MKDDVGHLECTVLRAADFSRFATVFFPLGGLFPFRPGICPLPVFFLFRGTFSASAGIFLASPKGIFFRIGMDFFRFEKEFFPRRKVFFTFLALFLLPKGIFPGAKRYVFRFGTECDKAARKDRTQASTEARQKTRKQTVTQSRHPKQQIQAKTRKQMSEQGRKKQQGTNQSTQATKQTRQPMY